MSVKSPKTSHKKNRPFDFKLIDMVEPHSILYQRQSGLSTFDAMKIKNEIWKNISMEMGQSIQFCMMRWNNLRGQFQKELRRCRELCPKSGVIRGSTWAYLDRLRFLEHTVQFNKHPKDQRTPKRISRKQSDSDCISIKEEDVDDDRVLEEEVEEHLQAISKLNDDDDDEEEEDSTEVGWEYLDSESGVNESTSSIEVFKQENDHLFQSQQDADLHHHQHHHHQQQQQEQHQRQNVVLDGSDFSIITEIIVNSDNIPQEVSISQAEDNPMGQLSVIEEHHGSTLYECPIKTQPSSLSQSPPLSHNSLSVTPTTTVVSEQRQQHQQIAMQQQHQRHQSISQSLHHSQQLQLQLQQHQQQQHQQQQQQQQQHHHQQSQPQYQQTAHLSGTTNNFDKMRYLLDGFDEANRQRVERRILAYLCKVQLYDLYNQDVSGLNI